MNFLFLLILGSQIVELDIDRALNLALKNNPSIRAEYTSFRGSKFQFVNTLSKFLPSPTLSVNYSDVETEVPLVAPGIPGGFTRVEKGYTFNFNINQIIFDPDYVESALNSYYSYKRAKFNLDERIRNFQLSVKEKYVNCLKSEKILKAREKALLRARENYRLIKRKYELGSATELDLQEALVSKTRAELEYEKARRDFELAKKDLIYTLGLKEDVELVLQDIPQVHIGEVPSYEQLMDSAMRMRGKVLSESLMKESKRVSFFRTLFSFMPTFKFGWYYTYSSEDFPSFRELREGSSRRSGLFASLTFHFFNYPFDVLLMRNQYTYYKWQLKSTIVSLRSEVERARTSLLNAVKEFELAKLLKEQSKRSLELARTQYKLGTISLIQLLDAEEKAVEGELSYYEAYYKLYLAVERLNAAVGGEVVQ